VKSFPYGPADRNGMEQSAVARGSLADSERYAAQVPEPGDAAVEQATTRGPF
jgi:hypothetical protein